MPRVRENEGLDDQRITGRWSGPRRRLLYLRSSVARAPPRPLGSGIARLKPGSDVADRRERWACNHAISDPIIRRFGCELARRNRRRTATMKKRKKTKH